MNYVRETYPWFNKTKGADHLLVMTNDKGACFIRGSVPQLEHVNLITQWGWVRPHIHRREVDVVVPPMLKVKEHDLPRLRLSHNISRDLPLRSNSDLIPISIRSRYDLLSDLPRWTSSSRSLLSWAPRPTSPPTWAPPPADTRWPLPIAPDAPDRS